MHEDAKRTRTFTLMKDAQERAEAILASAIRRSQRGERVAVLSADREAYVSQQAALLRATRGFDSRPLERIQFTWTETSSHLLTFLAQIPLLAESHFAPDVILVDMATSVPLLAPICHAIDVLLQSLGDAACCTVWLDAEAAEERSSGRDELLSRGFTLTA